MIMVDGEKFIKQFHFYIDMYILLDLKCDWILENQLNCHTRPIPFNWPSYWLPLYTTLTQCHYQAWLIGLLF